MSSKPRIAVIGAGLGGTTAATLLQHQGFEVALYEQAPGFSRLGAGINLGPNLMKVMRAIGVEQKLVDVGIRPEKWVSRAWDTGETMFEWQFRGHAERTYGAPYLLMHRGDFHAILTDAVAPGTLHFGKQVVGLDPRPGSVRLTFADGSTADADLVIGADGINSRVREVLLGPEPPLYTGYVAHRAIFPTALLGGLQVHDITKWWSDDTHIVIYFLRHTRDEIYFVSGVPEPHWDRDTAWVPADLDEMRAAFKGFHPEVQQIINACPQASKWPLFERKPLPLWSRGRIVLLGDACHPMKPHMGQGAAMAIEDAALLARCLMEGGDPEAAFERYKTSRIGRTSHVQQESHENTWLRHQMDPGWVFGYDAMAEPLPAVQSLAS